MTKTAYLICNDPNPSRYNNYSLMRALERRGLSVKIFALGGIRIKPRRANVKYEYDMCNPDDFDLVHGDRIETLDKADLCVFADPVFFLPESINIFQLIVNNKLKLLSDSFTNDVDPHWHASNKIKMHTALNNEFVATLNTRILSEDSDEYVLGEVEQVGGFPVIIKDPISALGRGVYRCSDLEELKTRRAEIATKNNCSLVVLQELHDIGGVMVCARVVGDKVWPRFTIGSPHRDDDFMANIGAGRAYFAHRRDEELEQLCVSATKALKLDTARVDVFVCDDGYKVCEVNSMGSILGADIAFNTDIGAEIVNRAIEKSIGL